MNSSHSYPYSYSRPPSPSTSQLPQSSSKYHHPYFTSEQVETLSEKQRGKLTVTQEERGRQAACGFIEAIGSRIGFPRKTIATAQSLYHRFHLYFPRKDFTYHDAAIAAMYVSTKMHDTLKKPRELLAVSYAVRFPELVAKSKNPAGEVDVDTMDQQMVENDRQRVLAVERLILETICFNFTSRMPFPYVIKFGRLLKASKRLTYLAWRLAVDSNRTLVPIEYPPHTIALGSLYVAALLSTFEQPNAEPDAQELVEKLGRHGQWEHQFLSHVEDLESISHLILDLLINGANQNMSTNTSPRTPSSPAPHISTRSVNPPPALQPAPYKADQLMRLKVAMRQNEHGPRARESVGESIEDMDRQESNTAIGKNEGTVRFLFGPASVVGNGV